MAGPGALLLLSCSCACLCSASLPATHVLSQRAAGAPGMAGPVAMPSRACMGRTAPGSGWDWKRCLRAC